MTYSLFKRFLDFFFALVALIFLSTLLVLVATAVYLCLRTPVLFRQYRPGLYTKPFVLLKFRTMTAHRDSSDNLLPDKYRMTRLGKFLRSTSIDELPSLINVLLGDISFIGPRPLLNQYLSLYTPEQLRRHDTMPGISGLAQINGRNSLSWDDKFRLDVWYVDHQNFLLDLRILLVSIWKVISRDGISASGEATMPPFMGSASTFHERL